jgi:hypothetical protein
MPSAVAGGAARRKSARNYPMRSINDPPPARLDELSGTDGRGMADDGDQVARATSLDPEDAKAAALVAECRSLDEAGEVFAETVAGCGVICISAGADQR